MISRISKKAVTSVQAAAAVLMFGSTILTCLNFITRYVFNYVIFGSEELATYMVLLMSFLMIPVLFAKNKHLAIDILVSTMKNKRIVQGLYLVQAACSVFLFGILTYYGTRVTAMAFNFHTGTPTLHMPKYLFFGVCTATLAITVLVWIIIVFLNKRRPL